MEAGCGNSRVSPATTSANHAPTRRTGSKKRNRMRSPALGCDGLPREHGFAQAAPAAPVEVSSVVDMPAGNAQQRLPCRLAKATTANVDDHNNTSTADRGSVTNTADVDAWRANRGDIAAAELTAQLQCLVTRIMSLSSASTAADLLVRLARPPHTHQEALALAIKATHGEGGVEQVKAVTSTLVDRLQAIAPSGMSDDQAGDVQGCLAVLYACIDAHRPAAELAAHIVDMVRSWSMWWPLELSL